MSREFCELYREAIEAVDEHWPSFWTGLAEELRQHQERNVTTRGAVVREFPAQREAEAQAAVAMRDAGAGTSAVTTRDAATGTSAVTHREAAVQVEPGDWLPDWDTSSEEDEEKAHEAGFGRGSPPRRDSPGRLVRPASPARPAMPDSTSHDDGCWNCGSRAHRARKCPRKQKVEFCFRCGTKGYTVKTCPHCGAGWRAQGPYVRGRGHEGPEPLRGRRARSGARPAPY